jgi:hypothetical protein
VGVSFIGGGKRCAQRKTRICHKSAFVKDAKGISFKNRFKGHINWRKVRNFNVIGMDESI